MLYLSRAFPCSKRLVFRDYAVRNSQNGWRQHRFFPLLGQKNFQKKYQEKTIELEIPGSTEENVNETWWKEATIYQVPALL